MPHCKIPAHLHPVADAILRDLVNRPKHRRRLSHGNAQLYRSLCGVAARMALGPLPNYKQRLALPHWKKQRQWEEMVLRYGDPEPNLPLKGRPYWRVSRGLGYDPSRARRRTGRPPVDQERASRRGLTLRRWRGSFLRGDSGASSRHRMKCLRAHLHPGPLHRPHRDLKSRHT